ATKLLPGGAPLETCLSFAVGTPTEFETQKVETGLSPAVATERHDPGLGRGEFQSEFPQTLLQLTIAALGIFFPLEAADKIVRISNQEGLASTATPEHFHEPQIERVVQVHIRQ